LGSDDSGIYGLFFAHMFYWSRKHPAVLQEKVDSFSLRLAASPSVTSVWMIDSMAFGRPARKQPAFSTIVLEMMGQMLGTSWTIPAFSLPLDAFMSNAG